MRPLKTFNSDLKLGKPVTVRWHKSGLDSKSNTKYLIDRGELDVTLNPEDECDNQLVFAEQMSDLSIFGGKNTSVNTNIDKIFSDKHCEESYHSKVSLLCDVILIPSFININTGKPFSYAGSASHDCNIGPFPCPFDQTQIDRIFRHGAW